ncbi:MAG: response regulator transcription factor [Acidobacteria bacterium]|nr:response regulator transcription factor [Acidobacteriota bacterium]
MKKDAGVLNHYPNESGMPAALLNRERPTILLADDEPAMLEGVRRLLEDEFQVIGTAQDGQMLVTEAKTLDPNLIVADISRPILNGFQAARRLKASSPGAGIIFLTVHEEVAFVAEALAIGVKGYVIKRFAAQDLIPAIRAVLEGQSYVSPAIQQ